MPILIFLLLAVGGMMFVYWFFTPAAEGGDGGEVVAAVAVEGSLSAIIYKNVPSQPVAQRLPQSPGPVRVGIVVGHRGFDSGAVCDDGLTEVEVNANIARQVVEQLEALRIPYDLLDEFDPRLQNYSATALISIHADSCVYYNELATGYKIAGSSFTNSSDLSICVEQSYADVTEMFYHANTITPHMTDYHAFRKIAPGTPAIIIETGFMNLDRELLTTEANIPARGIMEGILCFLAQQKENQGLTASR